MPIVALIGGHGVGKSTAVKRWTSRYSMLEGYSLDDMRKEFYSNAEKVQLVQRLQQSSTVGVVETAKGYSAWLKQLTPTDPVLIVTCATPLLGSQWMIARKGGKPLSAWWNTERFQYELIDKFLNFAAKNLNPSQVKHFQVRDQATDWPKIDAEFGAIFRALNNSRRS
jgi:hypothetical protein